MSPRINKSRRINHVLSTIKREPFEKAQKEKARYEGMLRLLQAQHVVLIESDLYHETRCSENLCNTSWLISHLTKHPPGE